jgi:carbonic anhydrase
MAMLKNALDREFAQREKWTLRRQLGVPNDRRLWVLACMDERLPVNEALGIKEGDAHVFRNAGGLVTDDAVRSAMLSCNFFGTEEIVLIQHTECGMMTATGEAIAKALQDKGVDTDGVAIDPALPELKLPKGSFANWIRMFDDVDEICVKQVEYLRNSPLIPKNATISGWVWEVESMRLRPPHRIISERVSTARAMRRAA